MQPFVFQGLLFREFLDTDAQDFANAARESVDTVGRWMPWCTASFSEQTRWTGLRCAAPAAMRRRAMSSACSRKTLAGCWVAGLNAINQQNLFCNLGYWVRQSAQRQGVAHRTVRAMLPYAFNTLGMHRVEIVIAAGNVASEAVARKAGAQFECTARNRLQLHGGPVPASIYSVIPSPRVAIRGGEPHGSPTDAPGKPPRCGCAVRYG